MIVPIERQSAQAMFLESTDESAAGQAQCPRRLCLVAARRGQGPDELLKLTAVAVNPLRSHALGLICQRRRFRVWADRVAFFIIKRQPLAVNSDLSPCFLSRVTSVLPSWRR